jgi:hypothetical protein
MTGSCAFYDFLNNVIICLRNKQCERRTWLLRSQRGLPPQRGKDGQQLAQAGGRFRFAKRIA